MSRKSSNTSLTPSIEQLIRHEGLRLTPCRCPAGTLPIGVGGNLFFTNMIRAVKEKDFQTAALEMKDSRWFTQVGDRAKTFVLMIKGSG